MIETLLIWAVIYTLAVYSIIVTGSKHDLKVENTRLRKKLKSLKEDKQA